MRKKNNNDESQFNGEKYLLLRGGYWLQFDGKSG